MDLTARPFAPSQRAAGVGMDAGLLHSGAGSAVIAMVSFGMHDCSYGNTVPLDILNHVIGRHEPNELLIDGCEIKKHLQNYTWKQGRV